MCGFALIFSVVQNDLSVIRWEDVLLISLTQVHTSEDLCVLNEMFEGACI